MASRGFRGGGRGRGRGGAGGSGPKRITTKLFVANLPDTVRKNELSKAFEAFGEVVECDIVKDYAFVHFSNESEAQAAIDALNDSDFHGSAMKVEMSTSRVRQKPGMGDKNECYRCGRGGHWSRDCPKGPGPMRGRDQPRRHSRGPYDDDPYGEPSYRSLPSRGPSIEEYLQRREEIIERERERRSTLALYRSRLSSASVLDRYRRYDPYERLQAPSRDPYRSDPYERPPPEFYQSRIASASANVAEPADPLSDPYLRSRYELLASGRVTSPR